MVQILPTSLSFCSCCSDFLVTMPPPSLRRTTRSCRRGLARPSGLHRPLTGPTKARARTPLTSTWAPRRHRRCAAPIRFLGNYWSTWQEAEEGQTCALSAPTRSVSREKDSPTTPRGPRPPCEHKRRALVNCVPRGISWAERAKRHRETAYLEGGGGRI